MYAQPQVIARNLMRLRFKPILIYLLSCFFIVESHAQKKSQKEITPKLYIDYLLDVTDVMVTDVASPPAAARFYAYACLAAHLAWENSIESTGNNLLMQSNYDMAGPSISSEFEVNRPFVATYSMLEVARRIMPSGQTLTTKQKDLISDFIKSKSLKKKDLPKQIEAAETIAEFVINLAKGDGYMQLSTLTRYSPKNKEGFWFPTPPAYMAAVEPEWRSIKPFFIKELTQYKPNPPAPFDLSDGSSFKNQLDEVYQVTNNLDEEMELIANFWDCNPFMISYSGHMAIGIKKISPGGHWVGITGIASQKAELDWQETLFIHALVSMGLHDAFISCWEEKYDSDRVRPESVINKHLDQTWRPLLQTPPFPEYTSGHSVISTTSAIILTNYFGDEFGFLDDTEVIYGLPEREFESFNQAAEEAAISRLYGGIHFRDAIEEGVNQGSLIGNYVLERIR